MNVLSSEDRSYVYLDYVESRKTTNEMISLLKRRSDSIDFNAVSLLGRFTTQGRGEQFFWADYWFCYKSLITGYLLKSVHSSSYTNNFVRQPIHFSIRICHFGIKKEHPGVFSCKYCRRSFYLYIIILMHIKNAIMSIQTANSGFGIRLLVKRVRVSFSGKEIHLCPKQIWSPPVFFKKEI